MFLKYGVVAGVPLSVPQELRTPIGRVHLGLGAVLGARMPESSVDEYGHLTPGEDDVRPDAGPRKVKAQVRAVAVARGVKEGSQRELGLGVATAVCLHVAAAGGVDA